MDIKDLYIFLHKQISSSNLRFTSRTSQEIQEISERYPQHAETILALIIYHEINSMKSKGTSKSINLEGSLISISSKKNHVHTLVYGGKTFDGGKGIKYINIEDSTFPNELKLIIVAYIAMITNPA